MRPYEQYALSVAKTNKHKSYEHPIECLSTTHDKIVENVFDLSDFLNKINRQGITDRNGDTLGLDVTSMALQRPEIDFKKTYDPSSEDKTAPVTSEAETTQGTYQTNNVMANHLMTYKQEDTFKNVKNFKERITRLWMIKRANNLQYVALNGTSSANVSSPENNGKDLFKGFRTLLSEQNSSNLVSEWPESPTNVGKITIDESGAGDLETLDELVEYMIDLLPEHMQQNPELKVFCGMKMARRHRIPIYKESKTASERILVQESSKTVAGLPMIAVPFFPDKSIMITTYDNLTYYYLKDSYRREIKNRVSRGAWTDDHYWEACFAIEDPQNISIAENIEMVGASI